MSTKTTSQEERTMFDSLVIEQRSTIEQLKRVVPNYRKLGKEKFTAVKTRNRIETLRELWASCRSYHTRLELAATDADRKKDYFAKQEFISAETWYEEGLDSLTELLDRFERESHSAAQHQEIANTSAQPTASAFELPRITIPPFKGEPTRWESFRDSFRSLVGTNNALTPGQKLYFLKSFLEGEAATLIEHIQVCDTNYQGAWEALMEEYDNPRALVTAHIHAFASLPVMKTETVHELKLLRDTVGTSLSALTNLKRPVEHWDDLLVYMIVLKFSQRTRTAWNQKLGSSTEYPTFQLLKEFLTERIRGNTDPLNTEEFRSSSRVAPSQNKARIRAAVHTTSSRLCPCCKGGHYLAFCTTFRRKSLDARYQIAKQARVCFNCLRDGHFPSQCPSDKTCSKCQRSHHSLLHRESSENRDWGSEGQHADASVPASTSAQVNTVSASAIYLASKGHPRRSESPTTHDDSKPALLATAWVKLRTPEGRVVTARALIDQGSAFSFITETLAQKLRTTRHRAELHITVFGEKYQGTAKAKVRLTLESRYDPNTGLPIVTYIFQKLSAYAAERIRSLKSWDHLRDLELADPDPSSTERIDVLIGADRYGALLLGPLRKGPLGTPTAQLTILGWIVSGPTGESTSDPPANQASINCVSSPNIDNLLTRFWEVEEVPSEQRLSPEDEKCESYFRRTFSRDANGRYIVRLPFREECPPQIRDNYESAVQRFTRDERRLGKNPSLAVDYNNFLAEYHALGHMECFKTIPSNVSPVYLPHHPVIRESSTTTRVRVVFNASSITADGTSLNDHLLAGPKLQRDIAAIILNWRQYRYVLSADITKMFRQIWIHPDDMYYQCIVWRPHPDSPVKRYRLRTVTYGTACAPYLALRVLLQLADDEGHELPQGAEIIRTACYVDDVLFGSDELDSAQIMKQQLIEIMGRGGFFLRKWAANDPELLSDFPSDDLASGSNRVLEEKSEHKILGLTWHPRDDCFRFQVTDSASFAPTKRAVLSFIARLYDPLGWATPVIISAKILLQDLWLHKVDWDENLPSSALRVWDDFRSDFHCLAELRIPRWTGSLHTTSAMELHGFSDASQRAYSAVVYLRILHSPTDIAVTLLAAKSKVAPLKTVAIPRLELNGAVLLVRLLDYVIRALHLDYVPIHGWTDSSVVLAWLSQHPSRWTPYVANRVSDIQTKLPQVKWHHVPSKSNPADCASRGVSASELRDHPLWWSGPPWLSRPSVFWPKNFEVENERDTSFHEIVESEKRTPVVTHTVCPSGIWELAYQFSSWGRLLRVTAYILRFVRNARAPASTIKKTQPALCAADIYLARAFWLKTVQRAYFEPEIRALQNKSPLPRSSSLRALNPFLDGNLLLRLGGRLRHAFLTYDERFPILLPRHHISDLIVDQTHLRSLHGGTQLTLRILRQNYWILGARTLVKARLRRCLTCVRERALAANQLMGDLPMARVNPSPPFSHSGVDYAGPFLVTPRTGRGQRARKFYVAVFVCFVSRAVHLEYAEDYSTAGFIAAFRRFTSRRGLPSNIYSDNGTNFVGADRELRHAFLAAMKDSQLHTFFADQGIKWHFIPASAPHFGGLWEAGVKSFKHHFKRVVGSRTLSLSEFSTLLCQIEACLNSRPLTALKDDPETFEALTPGHFLIGRPLLSVPEPSLLESKDHLLTRWQRTQCLRDHIWRAWSQDYLHTLHQRAKWRTRNPTIKEHDLVLIKNSNLPPCKWEKARVIEVHPGSDGLVRVVTVRTARATLKRPVTKICPLIVDE